MRALCSRTDTREFRRICYSAIMDKTLNDPFYEVEGVV